MKPNRYALGTAFTAAVTLFIISARAPAQTGPGYALSFNGTNSYAVNDSSPYMPFGGTPYTIEAWIKPNSMGNYGIIGWGSYGVSNAMNALSLRTNGLVNSWWGNDLVVITNLAGAWHHVAVAFNGNSTWRIMYVDGVRVASNSATANIIPPASAITVGQVGGSNYFDGLIDEVRVWSQARAPTNRFTRLNGDENSLSAYWRFDEGSGTFAADSEFFSLNGLTLTNSPAWVRSGALFSPQSFTSNATSVTTASGRLNAGVHPGNLPSQAWFRWGTTTGIATNTAQISVPAGVPADPSTPFQISSVLTNLSLSTTYYFAVAITNSAGTNYGAPTNSFTTLALPTNSSCALIFDGTNDYVATPNLAASFPDTNVTIELWFQAHGPGVLVDEYGQANPNGGWNDTQIEVVTTTTNTSYGDVRVRVWPLLSPGLSIGQVQYGTWNHVALRYNQTNSILDGLLNGVPGPTNSVVRQAPQKLGYGLFYGIGLGFSGTSLGSGAFFDGQIDEIRLWNLARSTAAIQANFCRPLAGNEPGLAAYYRFDECSGTLAADTTGHGYDGTLINGPIWTNSTVPFGPAVATLPATNLTTTSAALKGTANPQGFSTFAWFQWGATTNYGNTTIVTNVGNGTATLGLSTNIIPLVWSNTYHFRAVATNVYGTNYGSDQSFWLGTPLVTTLPATDLTTNAATINASVIASGPSAAAWFQWGLTTNYGSTTAVTNVGSGTVPLTVTNRLQPLLSGYTYHYRIVATNSFGLTSGQDLTFTGPVLGEVNVGLPGLYYSTAAWADYNRDGWHDLLLAGYSGSALSSTIYLNNGNGTFGTAVALTGVALGATAWGDYNNDGYLDILLTGASASGSISELYRNNGNGTFTEIITGLPGVDSGAVAWGDYNNDGYLDILLTGTTNGVPSGAISKIYRNNGNATFTDIAAGLPGVYDSSVAWGDYNNDGYLDILLTGASASGNTSRIYRNNGSGAFTDIIAGLPGVYSSSVAWGDYDNDGNLDILLSGMATEAPIFLADFESGNNGFTYLADPDSLNNLWHRTAHRSVSPNHSQYYGQEGIWTYDIGARTAGNLQSPPISLAGVTPPITLSFNYFLLNEGGTWDRATVSISTNGGSTWTALLSSYGDTLLATSVFANRVVDFSAYAGQNILLQFNFDTIDADVNNFEGWYVDDVTITGAGGSAVAPIDRVYHNNGDGTFTDIAAGLPGVCYSSVAWGDYDSDGNLDFLLMGTTNGSSSGAICRLYRNNGNHTFTHLATTGLPGACFGVCAWADYNPNARLDFMVAGLDAASLPVFHLYNNYWAISNTPPVGPRNLNANVIGTNVILSWSVGTDQQTPAPGLSYNLRVGTAPDGINVVSPQANTANGYRLLPQLGNMQQSLSYTLTGLKAGSNYYWSVQAVDSLFVGSGFLSEGSFAWTPAPSIGPAQMGSVMGNSAVISASVYPNGAASTAYIEWGTNTSYGNSTALVNVGSGMAPALLRQTLAGLQPGVLYHYRIVASNASGTTYGLAQTFYLDPNVLVGDANGDGMVDRGELDAVLADYWPTSPWLYMTNMAGLGHTNVTFALTNSTAGAYSVWMTTNLTDWEYLGPATPRYEFTDTNAPALPQRFYQLRWP